MKKKFILLLLPIFILITTGFINNKVDYDELAKKYTFLYETQNKLIKSNVKKIDIMRFSEELYNFHITGFDTDLAIAQMLVESRGDPNARGRANEKGIFQFMRATAIDITNKIGVNYVNGMEFNPFISLQLYYYHINELLQIFDNNTQLALLAYNCGYPTILNCLDYGYTVSEIKYMIYQYKGQVSYDDKVGQEYVKLQYMSL